VDTISDVAEGETSPALALEGDGTAHVAFVNAQGLGHRSNAGGTWTGGPITGDAVGEVAIAPGPRIAFASPAGRLSLAVPDGDGWRTETLVTDRSSFHLAAATDGCGALHLVHDASPVDAVYHTTDAPGVWATLPVERHTLQGLPSVAADRTGDAHFAFYDDEGWVIHRGPAGRRPIEQAVLDESVRAGTAIAVAPDGTVHVVWTTRGAIRHARGDQVTTVSDDATLARPALAVDAAGVLHLVWNADGTRILHATDRSGAWETVQVSPGATGAPAIALDASGRPRVVFATGATTLGFASCD
jgi:hypothetical protein